MNSTSTADSEAKNSVRELPELHRRFYDACGMKNVSLVTVAPGKVWRDGNRKYYWTMVFERNGKAARRILPVAVSLPTDDPRSCVSPEQVSLGVINGMIKESAIAKSNPCPKCGGSGILIQYDRIQNGICFRCSGSGIRPNWYEGGVDQYIQDVADGKVIYAKQE